MVEYGKIPREKHMVFRVLLREIDHHFPPKLRETQGNLKKKNWPNPVLCFVDFVFVETQNSGAFEYFKTVIRKTLQYNAFTP